MIVSSNLDCNLFLAVLRSVPTLSYPDGPRAGDILMRQHVLCNPDASYLFDPNLLTDVMSQMVAEGYFEPTSSAPYRLTQKAVDLLHEAGYC